MKQHGQAFFGIWQYPQVKLTCMILLSHIGQNYARMENVPLHFSLEY